MSSALSVQPYEPQPLPSLPPSPEPYADGPGHSWQTEQPDTPSADTTPQLLNGKGKGISLELTTPYKYGGFNGSIEASNSTEEVDQPKLDEEEESRKVEEHLRRWEVAERQRRKAAREIVSGSSASTLIGEVTRKASLLWSGKKSQRPPSGILGSHRALRTQETEDGVPLEDMDSSPINSPPPPDSENPFESLAHIRSDSTSSLNTPDRSALMSESSEPPKLSFDIPTPTASSSNLNDRHHHPPPKPLNLPRPRTPPPRCETPHANKPPEPIPPLPSVVPIPIEDDGNITPAPEVRWWTEWLCCCNEGPDRGGENQAGRTNPFE